MKASDWFRAVQILNSGFGDDVQLRDCFNAIGFYYFHHKHNYAKALEAFQSSKNYELQILCHMQLNDFSSLKKLIEEIPDSVDHRKLLDELGFYLESMGQCELACQSYEKTENFKRCVEACINLNVWDKALQYSQEHNYPQTEQLLQKQIAQGLAKPELSADHWRFVGCENRKEITGGGSSGEKLFL